MTDVTFLAHSGFLVETEEVLLLFDWWKGALPSLPPEKPLLVLVSHGHHDHFNPAVFALDDGTRPVRFLLGEGITPPAGHDCAVLRGGESVTLPEAAVETLPSTDEGVAFLVRCGGRTVYHAGDLNWWHWEGEPDPWNPRMEADFKRYTEPLRRRRLDLAFLPLDPRQQAAESWGFTYLLELADIRRAFPMHQWGDTSPTDRLLSARPDLWDRVVPVSREGQRWHFPD
ncbi:MBL fold metallo-hydrolase [Dysosmobacter sp.]|uniref:MBL fold metallo-hydrolase n=1 Tax=Dysosmobacter sp. TaxID=2591382 RepID=UPI002A8C962D|nr:MBL fold metallo-hydrolase [Dysosmobacter sp.]MDY3281821.1 MBL fold metallo-hydrolase [Dysosmobacter sp.]